MSSPPECASPATSAASRGAEGPATVCYRLRGRVGEDDRRFPLAPGENPVGGSRSNAVALPVHGVSRRHAMLRLASDGLTVEDLASKNGTFVNGRPVARSPVEAGDDLRFGPVTLRLEAVTAEDAELGENG